MVLPLPVLGLENFSVLVDVKDGGVQCRSNSPYLLNNPFLKLVEISDLKNWTEHSVALNVRIQSLDHEIKSAIVKPCGFSNNYIRFKKKGHCPFVCNLNALEEST